MPPRRVVAARRPGPVGRRPVPVAAARRPVAARPVGRPVVARPLVVAAAASSTSNTRNSRTPTATTTTTTRTTTAAAAASSSNHQASSNTTTTNSGSHYYATPMIIPLRARRTTRRASSLTGSTTFRAVFDLAKEQKWSEMKTKLDIQPAGAKFVEDGMMALHVACSCPDVPEDVVRKLLEHYDEAAAMVNNDGDLPLHLLVKNKGSVTNLLALIKVFPAGASVENNEKKAPISILYLNFLLPNVAENRSRISSVNTYAELRGDAEALEMFQEAVLLIFASASNHVTVPPSKFAKVDSNEEPNFEYITLVLGSALHGSPPTPPDLTELISRMFVKFVEIERNKRRDAAEKREEEAAILGLTATHPDEISLLHLTVDAGIGWNWGTKEVYSTDTTATEINTKGVTRLYPFAAAAVGCRTDEETVYELLRVNPDVLLEAIPRGYVLAAEKEAKRKEKKSNSSACKCVVM